MTREEAIQILTEHKNEYFHTSRIENAIDIAIEALSIVRCKDCRYRNKTKINEKGFEVCTASGMDITDNDFCSFGKRK